MANHIKHQSNFRVVIMIVVCFLRVATDLNTASSMNHSPCFLFCLWPCKMQRIMRVTFAVQRRRSVKQRETRRTKCWPKQKIKNLLFRPLSFFRWFYYFFIRCLPTVKFFNGGGGGGGGIPMALCDVTHFGGGNLNINRNHESDSGHDRFVMPQFTIY